VPDETTRNVASVSGREPDRKLILEIEIPGFYVHSDDIEFAASHGIAEDEELETEMNCDDTVQIVFLYEGDEVDPAHLKTLEGRIIKRRTAAL
jgi:hypothetical protein